MSKKDGTNNAKIGRHSRNPSSKQYTQAKRWITNKAKAIARHAKRMAKKAAHRAAWARRKGVHHA